MAEENKKNTDNGKQLIMMMALLMVLVMVGSAFFIYRMVLANTDAGPVKKAKEELGPRVELEETTVNFAGSTSRFLVAKFAFEAENEEVAMELDEKKDVLTDIVNLVLMEQTTDVLTPEGKNRLKNILMKYINNILTTGEIKNVYIIKFLAT